jgi:tetratricopeptide (TPR) repeat protein
MHWIGLRLRPFRWLRRLSGGVLFAVLVAGGITAQPAGTTHLSGSVRDSSGQPLPAATVLLQLATGTQIGTIHTDAQGAYDFVGLAEGAYRIRVQLDGYAPNVFDPVAVRGGETRRLDVVLQRSPQQSLERNPPEFFDEPHFTVAGVTDTTNLGTHGADTVVRTTNSLVRETASLGKPSDLARPDPSRAAEENSLRSALREQPDSFDANHRLGQLLLDSGRSREAVPYLDHAAHLKPNDDANTYALARACAAIGEYPHAASNLRSLLDRENRADAHHLLGEVEEKLGHPLEAVQEYQRAAELDPSEPNLFDWGGELLLHRAFEPAAEVFTRGTRQFPTSSRMMTGLGVALYARGAYEDAVRRLCQASDRDPASPTPYIFLGKIQTIEATQSKEITERLARFAQLQPKNALANYYYATSLWKARKAPGDAASLSDIESRLNTAVRLDPHLGPAFLQLGVLYEEQHKLHDAIAAYQQAIAADAQLEQVHYRLSQAYRRAGDAQKAAEELELYKETAKQSQDRAEREQRELRAFVYTMRDRPASELGEKPAQ